MASRIFVRTVDRGRPDRRRAGQAARGRLLHPGTHRRGGDPGDLGAQPRSARDLRAGVVWTCRPARRRLLCFRRPDGARGRQPQPCASRPRSLPARSSPSSSACLPCAPPAPSSSWSRSPPPKCCMPGASAARLFNGADGMGGVPRLDLTAIGIDLNDPSTFALAADRRSASSIWLLLELVVSSPFGRTLARHPAKSCPRRRARWACLPLPACGFHRSPERSRRSPEHSRCSTSISSRPTW